jgi:cytochrome P450
MTTIEGHIPAPRTCPFAPPAEYRALRDSEPVKVNLPGSQTAWAVSRMVDVRSMLTDPRVSSDARRPGFPNPYADENTVHGDSTDVLPLVEMDEPEHGRYRRMLIPEFSVRRVDALRPAIQDITDRLVDRLLERGPGADLVSAFALPIPSTVICRLLGVPDDRHEFFQSRAATAISLSATGDEWRTALLELHAFISDVVSEKIEHPADDLLSRLATEYLPIGALTRDRLTQLGVFLLASGFQTTADTIALGALTFLRYPDQLDALRADPSGAGDEMVRFHSLSDIDLSRIAAADLELAGRSIKAGDAIIPVLSAANRDPSAFDRPDEPDILRKNPRHHVGFGFGAHQCLGQNLARAELEIAYRTLFDRVPGLRLDCPVEAVDVRSDARIFGLNSLPVTW